MTKYYKNTLTGRGCCGSHPPDGGDYIEITLDEWNVMVKKMQKEMAAAVNDEEEAEMSMGEIDFKGLKINCYDDNKEWNIQITDSYINQYKEDLDLIEVGEISDTSITKEQYIELLKQRKQWRD